MPLRIYRIIVGAEPPVDGVDVAPDIRRDRLERGDDIPIPQRRQQALVQRIGAHQVRHRVGPDVGQTGRDGVVGRPDQNYGLQAISGRKGDQWRRMDVMGKSQRVGPEVRKREN